MRIVIRRRPPVAWLVRLGDFLTRHDLSLITLNAWQCIKRMLTVTVYAFLICFVLVVVFFYVDIATVAPDRQTFLQQTVSFFQRY